MHDASAELNPFYRQVLDALDGARIEYLIGGAFALFEYTGFRRDTKDLDLFVRAEDCVRAMAEARRLGYESRLEAPHWLAKVFHDGEFVDLIFNSGNGLAPVDAEWFARAPEARMGGRPVRLVPPEEMIWSKSFIMERHRYDGADVAHMLRACGGRMDWRRLLARFGDHWPVLLSHVVLYLYIYPAHGAAIPGWVLEELTRRTLAERDIAALDEPVCRGTFLSNFQYLHDLGHDGYHDARLAPYGPLTREQIALWNAHLRAERPLPPDS